MATLTIKGLPDELYRRLKKHAAEERRSINSQVIVCLERDLAVRRVDPRVILKRARALRQKLDLPPLSEEFLRQAKSQGRP